MISFTRIVTIEHMKPHLNLSLPETPSLIEMLNSQIRH